MFIPSSIFIRGSPYVGVAGRDQGKYVWEGVNIIHNTNTEWYNWQDSWPFWHHECNYVAQFKDDWIYDRFASIPGWWAQHICLLRPAKLTAGSNTSIVNVLTSFTELQGNRSDIISSKLAIMCIPKHIIIVSLL